MSETVLPWSLDDELKLEVLRANNFYEQIVSVSGAMGSMHYDGVFELAICRRCAAMVPLNREPGTGRTLVEVHYDEH